MEDRVIQYKLWRNGLLDEGYRTIEFWFCMPNVYDTYEEARKHSTFYYVRPRKLDSGEIVFDVYEKRTLRSGIVPTDEDEKYDFYYGDDVVIDTIHWNEHWKYKCTRVKEDKKDSGYLTDIDFEPYYAKFEEMYEKYNFVEKSKYALQNTTYMIEPIFA